MPTYNEVESFSSTYKRIRNTLNCDILVVDDNSLDGTRELIESIMKHDPNLFLLRRNAKLGVGSAYLSAFVFARILNYKGIAYLDADGSHQIEKLKEMVEEFNKGFDLVIGSRYCFGGDVTGWKRTRIILSRMGNLYSRIVLGSKVKDMSSGFRLFRVETLNNLDMEKANARGFAFQFQITHLYRNYKIKEVPITFVDRVFGKSKLSTKIILEAILWIPRIRLKS